MATFTATHGAEFGEQAAPKREGGIPGPYVAWAKFERDRERDGSDGTKVYVFTTDDESIAERLRGISDYGITEVKEPVEPPADPEVPVDPAA